MPDARLPAVAVVHVEAATDPELATLASVRRSHPELVVLAAGHHGGRQAEVEAAGAQWAGPSAIAAVNRAWEERPCHVLAVGGPVELPVRALDRALAMIDDDPRVATVSFFSDGAGILSFPRLRPGTVTPDLEPDAATATLRGATPALLPSPIPFPAGPVTLVGWPARSAAGPLEPGALDAALVAFSLRARRRGFFPFLDPSTFVRRLGGRPAPLPEREPEVTLFREYEAPESALSVAHVAARARTCGIHVLIDAARLGPQETGTQVATVALVRALARHAAVARVCVALAADLPGYATSLLEEPRVEARIAPDRDFSAFGRVDIAHRPFQPDSPLDMEACRAVAERTVITMLDLIAYHAVSYQLEPVGWTTYRDWLRQCVADVDAVVAPTYDVRRQILLERLPVDEERLVVAELGTDHLTGDEPEARPGALPPAGDGGGLLVVLGADYTHKNRDLAVRAHQALCERGHDLTLVLAGMAVHGSSREIEAEVRAPSQRVVVLPDISSLERNWLLRHAAAVLYPTAGEGFGFVPFEAARFGTPSAFVPFGPLAELAGPLPVHAEDWSPAALAGAAERLLTDPALARAQVEALVAAGDRLSWDATASRLAGIYHALLARPALVRPRPAPTDELDAARHALRHAQDERQALRRELDHIQQSVPYRLAMRANDVRAAVRRRRAPGCDESPASGH